MPKLVYLLPLLAMLSSSCDSQLSAGFHISEDETVMQTDPETGMPVMPVTLSPTGCKLSSQGAVMPGVIPVVGLSLSAPIELTSMEHCAEKTLAGSSYMEISCKVPNTMFSQAFDAVGQYRIDVDGDVRLPNFVFGESFIIGSGSIRIVQPGSILTLTPPMSFLSSIPGTPVPPTPWNPAYTWKPSAKKLSIDGMEIRFLAVIACKGPVSMLLDPFYFSVRSITLTPIAPSGVN